MNPEQMQKWKDEIDEMSQMEMASLWRFAPSGHPFFVSGTEVCAHFERRFKELGGFTPAISKALSR